MFVIAGTGGTTPPATAPGKSPVFQHAVVLDSYKGKPSSPGHKRKNSGSKLSPILTATQSDSDVVQAPAAAP